MVRVAFLGATCTAILMGVGMVPTPEVGDFPEFSIEDINLPDQPALLAGLGTLTVGLPAIAKDIEERVSMALPVLAPDTTPERVERLARIDLPKDIEAPELIADKTVNTMAATGIVNFGLDAAALDTLAKERLNDLSQRLQANPAIKVGIYGHTDLTGPSEYNDFLGLQRANRVARYLINTGVPSERISVVLSHGEREPMIETEAPSRDNRRVLIETF